MIMFRGDSEVTRVLGAVVPSKRRAPASRAASSTAASRAAVKRPKRAGPVSNESLVKSEMASERAVKYGPERSDFGANPSFRESRSVSQATENDYRRRFQILMLWAQIMSLPSETCRQMDILMTEWMNQEFFEGALVDDGEKTLAAVGFMRPDIPRGVHSPPRARRSLAGWLRHVA